MLRREQFSEFL